MKMLLEMVQLSEAKEMQQDFKALNEVFNLVKKVKNEFIAEGLMSDHNGPLEAEMNELERLFAVSRKGLSLANKLEDAESRTTHKRRMMSHMNKIRLKLDKVMQMLGIEDRETRQSLNISNFPSLRDAQDRRIGYRPQQEQQ